ncbi:MAG: tetratricopeptide repeat protein [Deltaproteobacteria bacterium]|nr:tetratricopeptide repeat protein [Deltaproteobacteria bacterium]
MADFRVEDLIVTLDETHEGDVAEWLGKAEEFESEGNLPKALDAYNRAVRAADDSLVIPRLKQAEIFLQMERWNQYVDALNDVSKRLSDEMIEEKVGLLKITVPILRDKMNIAPKVLDAYKRILEIKPDDEESFNELVDMITSMKRWPDLVKLYNSKLETLTDEYDKIPVLSEIARIYNDEMHNKREGVKAYEALLEVDPHNESAISNLKEMYEQGRDYDNLIALYKREMETISDGDELREKSLELAQMASTRIRTPETLMELWNNVIEVDPDNLEAMENLESLYDRAKDYENMVLISEKMLEILFDDKKKIDVCTKLAPIYQDKLEDNIKAINTWKILLELDSQNRRAQDALKKLLVDVKAWDELELLFTEWDKLEEYIRIISKESDHQDTDEGKLDLLFREARIWRENLDKSDRAMKAYEKILSVDDNNLESAQALIDLYIESNQHRKLPQVLEIRINHTEDEYTKRERMEELAGIYEEHLRDKDSAFTWYLEAFAQEPQREENRLKLEDLASGVKEGWNKVVKAYEESLESFSNPADSLPLLQVVAKAQEEELKDSDATLLTCKKILELDPSNNSALDGCERIYREKQKWEELLEIYSQKIELAFEEEEKKDLFWKKAEIFDSLLEKPDEAIDCYLAVLDFIPGHIESLSQLDALYLRLENWQELSDVIEKELDLAFDDTDARVSLKFRWSVIQESHLENVNDAVEGYREVLDLENGHEGARANLEKHLSDEDIFIKRSSADILEPIYELMGEFENLVKVHEIQAETEDDPEKTLELLLTIGKIWAENIGEPAKAFDALSRASVFNPESQEARSRLESISEIEDKWADTLAVYKKILESEDLSDDVKKEISIRAAQIAYEKLDLEDDSISFYSSALLIQPDNEEVLNALELLYGQSEKWEELLEISRKQLELAFEVDKRQALRFRCGELLDSNLDRPKEAVSVYEEILGEEHENLTALHALDVLYQKLEQWSELADNLTRQLELAFEIDTQSELLRRLAVLQHEKLDETVIAIETWKKALDLNNEDESVIKSLESLLTDEDNSLSVAKILEPVYKVLGRWENLIRTYEIMKAASFDPYEQIELLYRIATIYEDSVEKPESAFDAFSRAFRIDPTKIETIEQLERLSMSLSNWESLFELYEEKISSGDDIEIALNLQTRIAQLLSTAVGDIDRAAKAYEKLLEIKPDHIPAVDALEQLFLENGDTQKMVEAILKKVELVYDPDEKKQLAFRAADIQLNQLEKKEDAISTYRLILEIDDTDFDALQNLEAIFVQDGDWENLKDVYARKADLAPSMDEKKNMLYILGQVYDEEIKDLDKAIETYERVLDEDPVDDVALQRLDNLYERAEKWQELINILEIEIQNAMSDGEVASIKLRLGQIHELKLSDVSTAVPVYGEALSLDDNNSEIIVNITRVMNGGEADTEIEYSPEDRLGAANLLDTYYSRVMEPENLVSVLNVMVDQLEDSYEKVVQLHRLVEIHELQLNNHENARNDMGRAILLDWRNETTLSEIERLSGIAGDWNWLIAKYDEVLGLCEDDEDRIFFQILITRVFEDELQLLENATARLVKVLEIDPENEKALRGLDRLYDKQSMYDELTEILRKEIEIINDPMEILGFRSRLAQLLVDHLQKPQDAVIAYKELLEEAPDFAGARDGLEQLLKAGVVPSEIYQILEPLYRGDSDWERLVEISEVNLTFIEDAFERVSMLKIICDLHENYLADPEAAFKTYARAFAETAEDMEVNERLEELAMSLAMWPDLTVVYQQGAERERNFALINPDEAEDHNILSINIWLKCARVFEEEIHDPAGAENSNLQVLEIDPVNFTSLESLDRIYIENMMYPELSGILSRRAEASEDDYDRVNFYFRLAKLEEEQLGNIDKAVSALEHVVSVENDNIEGLEGLERLHFQSANWKDLYHVYERMTKAVTSDDEISEALSRMAKLSSDGLSDPVNAKGLWLKVLDLRGEDPRALGELAVLAENDENWDATVDFLDRITQASYETSEQINAYLSLGRVCLEKLSDHRRAMDAYLNVRSMDSVNIEALERLAYIYNESQAWEELVEVLEALVSAGNESLGTLKLRNRFAQIGHIEKEYLVRIDRAIDAWERVLSIQPGDKEALDALEILYTQEENWGSTIRILEEKLKVAQTIDNQRELLFLIADIWENRMYGKSEAADAYFRILALDKINTRAFENIERLYKDLELWDRLSEIYLKRYENLGGMDEDIPENNQGEIVSLLQRLAEVYEDKKHDREQAFVALSTAFDIEPTNNITAERLERIAGIEDNWQELLDMYEEAVEHEDDRKVKCDLLVKMGKWYADQLENLEKASEVLKQALKLDPNYGGVHIVLAEVHKKNGSIGEYIDELKRALEVEEDPTIRFKAASELAHVHEKEFADNQGAILYYRVAHESSPTDPVPIQALERLLESTEKWRELIDIIQERVTASTNEEEIIDLKIRIAELYDDRRESPTKAIETLNEILEMREDHLPAMRFLERLYDKIGDMEEYLSLLERQMNFVTNSDERVMKYHQMAAVWEEHYEKVDKSIECYEAILEINDKDEQAYRNLGRYYRQEKRWSDYIDILYRHVNSTFDPSEKVRLYKSAADALERYLEEPERAIDAYLAILDEEPRDVDALTALSRLYEQQGNWERSLDISQQLVELVDDDQVKKELYFRLGKISEEQLNDHDEAERLYAEALAIDPSFVGALRELSRIYEDRGDWIKASRMLDTAKEHTANIVDKAQYLYQSGVIYYDHLEDPQKAEELFSECLEIDPEHVDAALKYVDILWKNEKYSEMYSHLQMLVRKLKAQNADRDVMVQIYFRYGTSCHKMNELEKALKAFNEAFILEKSSLPILKGLASVHYALEQWEEAFSKFKQILVHLQGSDDTDLQTEIYYNLGNIRFKQNDLRRAQNLYDKALEMNHLHRPTLEAMVELYEKERNFKAAAEVKQQIIDAMEYSEKVSALLDLGTYFREKVKDDKLAIEVLSKALEIDPDNTTIIHELIELYQTTEQWKKVSRLMIKLAEMEQDPMIRSKIWYGVAGIYRSYINSLDDAIDYYNKVLDDDYTNLKAFSYIDKLLTQKKDWKLQERSYRKMIKRIMENNPSNTGLLVSLWHALGEIYRSRLRDMTSAMAAFETAIGYDPSDMSRFEILAELYTLSGNDTWPKAIEMYQEILNRNAYHTEALKNLYKLYLDTRAYDKAWCISSILNSLRLGEQQELEFFHQYKPGGFVKLQDRYTEDLWNRLIISPSEDVYLRHIAASISGPISLARGLTFKALGINRRNRQEPTGEGPMFTKIFFYLAEKMGVEVPEIYLLTDRRGTFNHYIGVEKGQRIPIMTVGLDMLQGHMEKDLGFHIAKELTYMRPEHYLLKNVQSVGEFTAFILGAIRLVNPTVQLPGDANVINQTAAQLNGLLPQANKEALAGIVSRMVAANHLPNINEYIKAVELSSHRAAMTAVQDLDTALTIIQSEPMVSGGGSNQDKKEAIIRFTTSEQFFELRKYLGVAIG